MTILDERSITFKKPLRAYSCKPSLYAPVHPFNASVSSEIFTEEVASILSRLITGEKDFIEVEEAKASFNDDYISFGGEALSCNPDAMEKRTIFILQADAFNLRSFTECVSFRPNVKYNCIFIKLWSASGNSFLEVSKCRSNELVTIYDIDLSKSSLIDASDESSWLAAIFFTFGNYPAVIDHFAMHAKDPEIKEEAFYLASYLRAISSNRDIFSKAMDGAIAKSVFFDATRAGRNLLPVSSFFRIEDKLYSDKDWIYDVV
ncbi:MAG: hypothetical protein LBT59_23070 [Clostridiales bacterium]|jgi:hypothetical protein|nr:hypothetical protein [Clostridiales bacterium]